MALEELHHPECSVLREFHYNRPMAYMSNQQMTTLEHGGFDSVWNISMQPG